MPPPLVGAAALHPSSQIPFLLVTTNEIEHESLATQMPRVVTIEHVSLNDLFLGQSFECDQNPWMPG
jgi:hypothetical protein